MKNHEKASYIVNKKGERLTFNYISPLTRGTIGREHKQTPTLEFYHRLITSQYWDVISSTVQC